MWNEPKAFYQKGAVRRHPLEILDKQVEPFPVKPRERGIHRCGITPHPPLVHAHAAKPFEQGCLRRPEASTVDAESFVGAVVIAPESLGKDACHGRLAGTAAATQPSHVLQVGHLMILHQSGSLSPEVSLGYALVPAAYGYTRPCHIWPVRIG
jgi:hypothetical protein